MFSEHGERVTCGEPDPAARARSGRLDYPALPGHFGLNISILGGSFASQVIQLVWIFPSFL